MHKEQLSREHRFLRRRLDQLTSQTGLHGLHGLHGLSSSAPTGSSCGPGAAAAAAAALLSKRRSVSECSLGTASSTSSTASSRNSDRSAGSPSVSESGEYTSTAPCLDSCCTAPCRDVATNLQPTRVACKGISLRAPLNAFFGHYYRVARYAYVFVYPGAFEYWRSVLELREMKSDVGCGSLIKGCRLYEVYRKMWAYFQWKL